MSDFVKREHRQEDIDEYSRAERLSHVHVPMRRVTRERFRLVDGWYTATITWGDDPADFDIESAETPSGVLIFNEEPMNEWACRVFEDLEMQVFDHFDEIVAREAECDSI